LPLEAGLKIEAELGYQTVQSGETHAGARAFSEGAGRRGEGII
jgi:hypothetical protein